MWGSSDMKNAGEARSYGLYRHLRISKEIIENLLNYSKNNKNDSAWRSVGNICLLKDIDRNGYRCTGKPEPLKGNLSGYWSVRIDKKKSVLSPNRLRQHAFFTYSSSVGKPWLSGQKELVLAPEFGVGRCPMKLAPYYCITPCRDWTFYLFLRREPFVYLRNTFIRWHYL